MNFLAHLYLAEGSPEFRVGNLLPDFLRGEEIPVGAEFRRGMGLHQAVDVFTDAHPIFLVSKRRISPVHRRFSGVLIDVFYDHFLATGWAEYSSVSLQEFNREAYALLVGHAPRLPSPVQLAFSRMIEQDWLASYAQVDGVRLTLGRIARRLRRPYPLEEAVEELEANYEELQRDFRVFFPELQDFVREYHTE